jgi:hypothetical protein
MTLGNQRMITEDNDSSWRILYKLGGLAAIIAIMGTMLDITLTFLPGWSASTVPETAIDWFAQFQSNWLLGLRNLDLLNIIISIVTIPMYCALYAVHKEARKGYGLIAMILFIVGTLVFITNNTALPMLSLSSKYALAGTDAQKLLIAAAGEAMLARGEHGSPGVFIGFFLSTMASITLAFVMLKGKIFSKLTAYIGILGFILLLTYTVFITFVSKSNNLIMILAMPGGLLAVAWNIMVARKLIRLGSKETHIKERSLQL